jgi:hypothetical protein
MKTFVFTPPDETGILVAHIVPYAGSHDTRLGRESSWLQAPAGSIFFRPLMVKGLFCALTSRAAFLFRGNFKRTFLPAPPGAHPSVTLVRELASSWGSPT